MMSLNVFSLFIDFRLKIQRDPRRLVLLNTNQSAERIHPKAFFLGFNVQIFRLLRILESWIQQRLALDLFSLCQIFNHDIGLTWLRLQANFGAFRYEPFLSEFDLFSWLSILFAQPFIILSTFCFWNLLMFWPQFS